MDSEDSIAVFGGLVALSRQSEAERRGKRRAEKPLAPMMRARVILTLALINALVPSCGLAQDRIVAVSVGPNGVAQLALGDGRQITIPKERGQVGISEARIASDGTVGWLADFRVESVSYPISEALIIWRAGRIMRRFQSAQVFYSWAFYAQGKQVAFHVGPLHGERSAHCELHDVASGRMIAAWDGDLRSIHDRPAWAKGLPR